MVGISWSALRERPLVFPAIFFSIGVALGAPPGVPTWVLFTLACAAAAISLLFSNASGSHALFLSGCTVLGACLSTLEASAVVPQLHGPIQLVGTVERVDNRQPGSQVLLRAEAVDGAPAHFLASLTSREPVIPRLQPGQRVAFTTQLKPYPLTSNPGEHDVATLYARRAQLFRGGFEAARVARLSPPAAWRGWVESRRDALAQRVHQLAPSPESAALFLALASGQREALSEQAEQDFARSGLAHLLSVSGLHVAALALALLWTLRWLLVHSPLPLMRSLDARRVAAIFCVPLLWGYVIFTGGEPPAMRSAVMATAYFAGLALARQSDGLNAVALAAVVLLAISPSSLFELSLQLSFLAVVSLILLTPAVQQRLGLPAFDLGDSRVRKLAKKAARAALQTGYASIAVTLATLPLLAGAFGQISLIGVLANAAVLPLSGTLTVLAAGSAGIGLFSEWLSWPLIVVGTHVAKVFSALNHAFASAPLAALAVTPVPVTLALGWWGLLAAWALGKGRLTRFAGWALVPALFALLFGGARSSTDALEVTFLAVGHGDATVVSHRGHHALIDGGGVPNGTDTGRRFVLPFLRKRGINTLDLAVLTHAHPDHGLGLASALRQVPTQRLWLSAASPPGPLVSDVIAAAGRASVERVNVDRAPFWLGGARVQVLGPALDTSLLEGENDRSLVLRVDYGEVSFLLTGDIEEAAEQALRFEPVTVLKAPHHGSATSSTPGFISATRPRYVVFCVGPLNRYGLPDEEVVERYQQTGARCFRTDRDGAVTFRTDGREVKVETFLESAGLQMDERAERRR